jgi:uncharacterized protein YciU (UPF0263 family)
VTRPELSDRVYVRLDPADIARFRFQMEACDNLALFTMVDKYRAVVRVIFAPNARAEALAALAAIGESVPLEVIARPQRTRD